MRESVENNQIETFSEVKRQKLPIFGPKNLKNGKIGKFSTEILAKLVSLK